ncbi:putative Late nodulin [Medicago truncatula]|uniref:Nodule Cysteine-Rich (NCR) secreted peptide n=1 Tax=Medicago truncatula TaxID=3880 RepID=A0A072VK07_MEDTR|nr:Nodule Cysteine-Rich (NCR) secreted peptide [Medicago truncatula]RHN79715.1 putative Late nodulin [Medicago truncatula]
MAQIVKLVYVMIIFISLFFVAINVDAIPFRVCFHNRDCPRNMCLPSIPYCRFREKNVRFGSPLGLCSCD